MTQIGFYHLTRSPLEQALPKLLDKALAAGYRAVVLAGSSERVEALSDRLWTYEPESWLPHGSAKDGDAALQPIWLTATDENPGRDGRPPARWFRAKGRTVEQKAAWVTAQLRECGFDTEPVGGTWGLLKEG